MVFRSIAIALGFFLCAPAQAQSLVGTSVELGLSSLGLSVVPSYIVSPTLSVRAPVYFGGRDGSYTDDDGNILTGKADLTSAIVLADYRPFENGFRVSGGLALGGYRANATVTNPTIDGTTYSGTFDVRLAQKNDIQPVFSMGFAYPMGGKILLSGDVGAKIGTYRLVAEGGSLTPVEQAGFDNEIARMNNDLSQLKATPFLSVGIGFQF